MAQVMEPDPLEPDVITGPHPPGIEQAVTYGLAGPVQHEPLMSTANMLGQSIKHPLGRQDHPMAGAGLGWGELGPAPPRRPLPVDEHAAAQPVDRWCNATRGGRLGAARRSRFTSRNPSRNGDQSNGAATPEQGCGHSELVAAGQPWDGPGCSTEGGDATPVCARVAGA